MLANPLKLIFGSSHQRTVNRLAKTVHKINALEESTAALPDARLSARTGEFRARLAKGETLDSLLPEAFAVVREAGKRVMNMRHYDVQMMGGMVLHQGKIAEMRTGEGKTLVGTLAVYLNALTGKGVHVVTVNDYLASRDAAWMKPLYEYLGLTVGVIGAGQTPDEKRAAYAADITYGTNNEFGFDYLRDNMAFRLEERVQRPLHYAIIDEVDSILIDEARTPLIISGATDDSTELYERIDKLVPRLVRQKEEDGPGDFSVDEKARQVHQFVVPFRDIPVRAAQHEKRLLRLGCVDRDGQMPLRIGRETARILVPVLVLHRLVHVPDPPVPVPRPRRQIAEQQQQQQPAHHAWHFTSPRRPARPQQLAAFALPPTGKYRFRFSPSNCQNPLSRFDRIAT